MQILINGVAQQLDPVPSSLLALLQQLAYLPAAGEPVTPPTRFVVALNQHIVSSHLYPSTVVRDGDCIDVLGVMTGG